MKSPTVAASPTGLEGALRSYLYLTAAVSGAAIMVVEILGAKMLAPYVGTSHFVWTAQIAVTMVALAVGYYVGGRQADRTQRLGWLYTALLVAAVYLSGIVLVLRPVAHWCLEFRLAWGSLVASTLLFFVPLSLMAMTGPFLVRFLTVSVSSVGGSVGRLIAVGTLGSFVGTVLIGYVLIPFLANSTTMLLTAGTMAALSIGYFVVWGRGRRGLKPALALVVLGLILGSAGWWRNHRPRDAMLVELFRSNSNFGEMQVLEHQSGKPRYFLNDLLVQNTYDPEEKSGLSAFTYLLHGLARAYTPQIDRALCIGLGIGLVPATFAREGVEVDVVEINPRVADVADRFFDCPLDSFQLTIADGRQFINRTTHRYDTIILDAFIGDSSPVHLMSSEAFGAMRERLRPNGTLVINCFADFHPGRDFYGASLNKTLRSVFKAVKLHATGSGNVYFVASDREPLTVLREPDFEQVHQQVRWQTRYAFGATMEANPDRGLVLTDDYNPLEAFDALNRESIRRNLARSMDR